MEPTHFESLYPSTVREKEIEGIIKYIKEGNSAQIVSFPGVGRSNLLGFLSYNQSVRLKHLGENQKWFHFVPINFSEIRNRPLFDATKFIFLSLINSLRERKMEEEYKKVNEIFKENLTENDELILFQGLKSAIDFLAIQKELTIVFLFDRFEEYVPILSSQFFTNLRTLRNRAKYRFSVVFSTGRVLEDILEPGILSEFYEFVAGHIIYLPLTDKPGLDFRVGYLEKVTGKKIAQKDLEEIIALTAGHAKLTRLCLETVLAGNNANNQNLLEFLLSQKPIQGNLYEIWTSLTPSEQTILSSKSEKIENSYLESTELIKNGKISIPLFDKFVKNLSSLKKDANIVFDSVKNEITKGGIVLSDTLTSSEYRLLKFAIQNSNKIIEREELINAVWQNAKSTAGVTDQALDQLIFRVRKKIEDNPISPTHLLTVKGRGIRFTP